MASRSNYSRIPNLSSVKHPLHDLALQMIQNRPEFLELAQKARKIVQEKSLMITPTLYDHKALLTELGPKTLQKYRDIIQSVLDSEKDLVLATREFPKPPPAVALYGRVEKGAPVLDVGSGDGKRLLQFEGPLNVRAMDKEDPGFRANCDFEVKAFEEPTKEVVVSFNSMTNNKDMSAFEGSDGIHVIPDLDKLVKDKYSGKTSEYFQEVYVTQVEDKTYFDYKEDIPSEPINNYYRVCNTFRQRSIAVELSLDPIMGARAPELSSYGRRVVNKPFVMESMTWKMSGELFKIRHRKIKGVWCLFAWDRGGRLYAGRSSEEVDFDLLLERFQDRWYLLALDLYRGVKPYHSLKLLNYFLERVDFTISGEKLIVPMEIDSLDDPPEWAEGVVFRRGFEDHLFRFHHSFDVDAEGFKTLKDVLTHYGYIFTCDLVHPGDGIYEYLLFQDGTSYELKLVGKRDKTKRDTKRTIMNMLQWPTLYQELMEKKCTIEGTKEEVDDETDDEI